MRKGTADTHNNVYDREFVCMLYPAISGKLPHDIANHMLYEKIHSKIHSYKQMEESFQNAIGSNNGTKKKYSIPMP